MLLNISVGHQLCPSLKLCPTMSLILSALHLVVDVSSWLLGFWNSFKCLWRFLKVILRSSKLSSGNWTGFNDLDDASPLIHEPWSVGELNWRSVFGSELSVALQHELNHFITISSFLVHFYFSHFLLCANRDSSTFQCGCVTAMNFLTLQMMSSDWFVCFDAAAVPSECETWRADVVDDQTHKQGVASMRWGGDVGGAALTLKVQTTKFTNYLGSITVSSWIVCFIRLSSGQDYY